MADFDDKNVDVSNGSDKKMLSYFGGGAVAFVVAGVVIAATSPVVPPSLNVGVPEPGMMVESDSDFSMISNIIYTPSDILPDSAEPGLLYEFVGYDAETMLTKVASALQVEGEYFTETYECEDAGVSTDHWWGQKEDDGSVRYDKPYISVYVAGDSTPTSWNYSKGWDFDERFDPESREDFDAPVDDLMIEPAPMPLPMIDAPYYDPDAALKEVESIITSLGYTITDFNVMVYTDWGVNVTLEFLLNGEATPLVSSFIFETNGLQYAYGFLGTLVPQGEIGLVSPYNAVDRLNTGEFTAWAANSIYEKYYPRDNDGMFYDRMEELYDGSEYSGEITDGDTPVSSEDSPIYDDNFVSEPYSGEPTVVMVDSFDTVWTIIYDVEGKMFLAPGYIMFNSEDSTYFQTVSAVDDTVFAFQKNDFATMEPYFD